MEMANSLMKIVQINTGRAKNASAEIRSLINKTNIDLVLIQEPYVIKRTITGYGKKATIITGNKAEESPWAAIVSFTKNYTIMRLSHRSTSHIVCAQIEKGDLDFYVISGYFQYSHAIQIYIEQLRNALNFLKGKMIIIGIDSNARSPTWFSDELDERGDELEEFINEMGLYCINENQNTKTYSSTRGESNIDITLTTQSALRQIRSWNIKENWITSDHNAILIEVGNPNPRINGKIIKNRYNTNKANWETFTKKLIENTREIETECIDKQSVIKLTREIRKAIIKTCDESIPKKKITQYETNWWTKELEKLKKATNAARRKFKKEKKNENRRQQLIEEYRDKKLIYKKRLKETAIKSWEEFVKKESKDPWGFIYKISCGKMKSQTAIESVKHGDTLTSTWRETAEVHLDKLFCYDTEQNDTEEQEILRAKMYEMDTNLITEETPFTTSELAEVIKKMRNRKSPGWDKIEVVIVKNAWTILQDMFTRLFNSCLTHKIFPNEWKIARVATILKSANKDQQEPSSYRPVCLLPVMGKVMEGLILRRIHKNVDENLSQYQYGFRSHKNTEDAVCKFLEIRQEIQENYALGMFLDISGAFNNLWWPDVIQKLKDVSCSAPLVGTLQDYFKNRSIFIKTNSGIVSREVNKGCPQGSLLGPILWNLVFDDLIKILRANGYKVVVYADDKVIIITGNTRRELEKNGQTAIDIANNWCVQHKMSLSPSKSVTMLIKGSLNLDRAPKITLKNKNMRMVKEFRYLGINFRSGMKVLGIDGHMKDITTKS